MGGEVEINMDVVEKNDRASRKDYEKYKRLIENFQRQSPDDDTFPAFVTRFDDKPSEFEEIMMSYDDKSALICMVQRKLRLWCNGTFWNKQLNLDRVMSHYANDANANLKNFFSILKYDWCDPQNNDSSLLWILKFNKYKENARNGKSLFERLCEIANDHRQFNAACRYNLYCYLFELVDAKVENLNAMLLEFIGFANIVTDHPSRSCILLDLMQILKKSNDEGDMYEEIKAKLFESLDNNVQFNSIYNRSLKDVNCAYNQAYFELNFLLVEENLDEFKIKFVEFLDMAKSSFGEHWHLYTTNEISLLLNITCTVNLAGIYYFIKTKCDFLDNVHSDAVRSPVYNEPLPSRKLAILNAMDELLKRTSSGDAPSDKEFLKLLEKFDIELLFSRMGHGELSVIEKITINPKLSDVMCAVWEKFQMWECPNSLVSDNPLGKTIIDYLLDSDDDNHILAFLSIPNSKSRRKIVEKQKHYMLFFNAQMSAHENFEKCFVEFFIDLINNKQTKLVKEYRRHLMYLFEEIGEVAINSEDSIIEMLINAHQIPDINVKFLSEYDRILRFMLIYWKPEGKQYEKYKTQIIKQLPSHELLFYIIEGEYERFFQTYEVNSMRLAVDFGKRYKGFKNSEILKSFSFDILFLGMRKNQKKIVEFILKQHTFEEFDTYLPENFEMEEVYHFTAQSVMQRRNRIAIDNFPVEWFTIEGLGQFLDSKIAWFNQEYYEIDLSFMLEKEVSSLQYLENKVNLHGMEILLHPIVETYVNLRSCKYNRIYEWNYLAFMLLFLAPFIPLILYNHSRKDTDDYWSHFGLEKLHYIGIIYLISREMFQFFTESKKMDYFKQKSNWLEFALITTAILLSAFSSIHYEHIVIVCFEILFILMTTLSATTLNYLTKNPVFFIILKKISVIFLNIIHVFIFIILGLAFCIYVVLDEGAENKQDEDDKTGCLQDVDATTTKPEEESEAEKFIKLPVSSLIRVLTMLSGEFSFELDKMSTFKLVFCLLFVITAFILFNLIVGVSFENIESIMSESRQLNVLDKIKKLIQMEEKFCDIEKRIKGNSRFLLPVLNFFLRQYEYVPKLQKVYVEMSTKKIYVRVNGKRERVLKKLGKTTGPNYEIEDVTYNAIQAIDAERKKQADEDQKEEQKE